MMQINYMAVFVAAISNFIIGFLLHGPILGKVWMKLANIHPTGEERLLDMWPKLLQNFLVHIVFVYVFSVVYLFASTSPILGGSSVLNGVKLALLVWLGFLCTTTSIEVIWMGRSLKLWLFEVFCSLITCIAMGAIIAAWQ
ncbi:MAG: DUF1761 domain-containing protein [Proteobacteria bacterium]|nr:DUF1761 domain-containing protein [Pseudomonadota bacterium]